MQAVGNQCGGPSRSPASRPLGLVSSTTARWQPHQIPPGPLLSIVRNRLEISALITFKRQFERPGGWDGPRSYWREMLLVDN
jgi:hypothetical protein